MGGCRWLASHLKRWLMPPQLAGGALRTTLKSISEEAAGHPKMNLEVARRPPPVGRGGRVPLQATSMGCVRPPPRVGLGL
jgi:hypothetical protein